VLDEGHMNEPSLEHAESMSTLGAPSSTGGGDLTRDFGSVGGVFSQAERELEQRLPDENVIAEVPSETEDLEDAEQEDAPMPGGLTAGLNARDFAAASAPPRWWEMPNGVTNARKGRPGAASPVSDATDFGTEGTAEQPNSHAGSISATPLPEVDAPSSDVEPEDADDAQDDSVTEQTHPSSLDALLDDDELSKETQLEEAELIDSPGSPGRPRATSYADVLPPRAPRSVVSAISSVGRSISRLHSSLLTDACSTRRRRTWASRTSRTSTARVICSAKQRRASASVAEDSECPWTPALSRR
jgi:hypothetical protein